MSDVRLRARSATEIVDAAFALYRRQPLQYILLTAFAYAPWLVLQLVLVGMGSGMAGAGGEVAGLGAPAAISLIIAVGNLITYSVMSAALVRLVSQAYLGEAADLGAAVRGAIPRVPAIIGAALLKTLLLLVGAVLLLVGMLYVAARWFAPNQAIILEGRGVLDAFSRSSDLSRGRKAHILGTLALVLVIYLLLGMAVGMVSALTRSDVMRVVLTTAYVIVAYPLFGISETLLYYDARIRGEGFDIELLAGGLGGQAEAEAQRTAP